MPTDKQWKAFWKSKPTASSDCVVVKGKNILLVKRAHKPFMGYWTLPGGLMENGERIEQTALREVREETGIRGKITGMIGVYSAPGRDPRGASLSVAFLIKYISTEGKPDSESSAVRFFPFDNIPDKIGFDHKTIIKDAFKMLRQSKR